MSDQVESNQAFILVNEDSAPEIYADGVGQTALGAAMSKVTFYSVLRIQADGSEVREPAVRIAIPTNALLELSRNVLAHATANQAGLTRAYEYMKDFGDKMLDGISVTVAPTVSPPSFENE